MENRIENYSFLIIFDQILKSILINIINILTLISNCSLIEHNEVNEIPEESPLDNLNKNSGVGEVVDDKSNSIAYNDYLNQITSSNAVNEEPNKMNGEGKLVKPNFNINDHDEEVNYNFIEIDERNKPESNLTVSIFRFHLYKCFLI